MTIKGSRPPIHPAARLCGSVAALFLVFAGNSSASNAVWGPTTKAKIADRPINMIVMAAVELLFEFLPSTSRRENAGKIKVAPKMRPPITTGLLPILSDNHPAKTVSGSRATVAYTLNRSTSCDGNLTEVFKKTEV